MRNVFAWAAVASFCLVGCGEALLDVGGEEEFDDTGVAESELTGWGSVIGVYRGVSGPYEAIAFQKQVAGPGHRYLAERGGNAESGRFTVKEPALSLRTASGALRTYRMRRPSPGVLLLTNSAGTVVARLERNDDAVSECARLLCAAVRACTEHATGARCEPPRTLTGAHPSLNADGVLVLKGKKVLPIGFTMPPPPESIAPSGKNAIEELRSAGATFLRTGPLGMPWNDDAFAKEQQWQSAAAAHGMYTWLYLKDQAILGENDSASEAVLRRVVNTFRDSPALGAYKGADEPAWGAKSVEGMMRARELVRSLDPLHAITIIHAPRSTVAELSKYNPTADIIGTDIYPVSDPMGADSHLLNKTLSAVGDYTDRMREVSSHRKGIWMTLQIAWSGIVPPHARVMPTLHQERFMTYDALINGARGLFFFGGHMDVAFEGNDAKLGWAWTFWDSVLKRVVSEVGDFSPLHEALLAPESDLPVRIFGDAHGVEFMVRQAGGHVFVVAARKAGSAGAVTFRGLPQAISAGTVLFENGRTVAVKDGRFSDSFAPFDVHVYRFTP